MTETAEHAHKHNGNLGDTEKIIFSLGGGALAIYGLTRRSTAGAVLTALGAGMLHRGVTGYCQFYNALGIDHANSAERDRIARDIHIEKSVTVNRSPEELYRFWRNFENLPRFMNNLDSVVVTDAQHSHWKVKGPAGSTIEWDAEIYNKKENELISWRTLEGADVVNAGTVRFEQAPNGRGTYVRVSLNYNAPAGRISALIAKLFGQEPGQMIEEDLRRFKQVMEAGELATVEGQPSGRQAEAQPVTKQSKETIRKEATESVLSMSHAD